MNSSIRVLPPGTLAVSGFQKARGVAGNGRAGLHVAKDDRPDADHRPPSDPERPPSPHDRADADERLVYHCDIAREIGAGRDVHTATDDAVVIDGGGRIEDRIIADHS